MKPEDKPPYPPSAMTADDMYGVIMNLFDKAHLSDDDAQGYVLSVASELASMAVARVAPDEQEKVVKFLADRVYTLAREKGKMASQVSEIADRVRAQQKKGPTIELP